MRIDKFLADNLNISREAAKELIKCRKVSLNGKVIRLYDEKVSEGDTVTADGREIVFTKHIYMMLNKPAGLVCENRKTDEGTVFSCIPENLRRKNLSVCGRLDKDTEGLLIITDDGDFVHKIISPVKKIPKTYFARLKTAAESSLVESFKSGVIIDGGEKCKPAKLQITDNPFEVYITIFEGKYHQVKRMMAALGNEVLYLRRISCGDLTLPEKLPVGGVVTLTPTDCAKCSKSSTLFYEN
ncbi:MAG: rRNA pseudouridine synthase [Ruminococcus sp.]|jgi:16S rRNA pseudouridine516 synthase|nr:rRNA pseudouridine synthase [Ruminococcus sp.]